MTKNDSNRNRNYSENRRGGVGREEIEEVKEK